MNLELEILNLKQRIEELERIVLKRDSVFVEETKAANRDKTKYMFEGKVLPKNRLVLAVIKKYVAENDVTFEELCGVFDRSLQGSLGVVELLQNAQKVADGPKRYFMKNEDVLILNGQKVVVCTQWGIFNIVKFIKRAEALNYIIDSI